MKESKTDWFSTENLFFLTLRIINVIFPAGGHKKLWLHALKIYYQLKEKKTIKKIWSNNNNNKYVNVETSKTDKF